MTTKRTTRTKEKRAPAKRARGPNDAHLLLAKSEEVIRLYAEGGKSVRACCKMAKISWPAFSDRLAANPALAARYARARVLADEIEFEALTDISDEEPPVDAFGKHDSAWVTWQRTRIDTRKWMLARKQPSKYGDRQQIDHNVTADTAAILMAARKRSGKSG